MQVMSLDSMAMLLSIAAVGNVAAVSSTNAVGYATHVPQTTTACDGPIAQHAWPTR
jgi:hypothetical protein